MRNELTVNLANDWSATLDLATGEVSVFDNEGHFATSGRWAHDKITDAPAPLPDGIYDELDEALKTTLDEFRDAPSKLRLYQDGEPVDTCTFAEFAEANRDSPDLLADVRALEIGESTEGGGGAAPAFRIERLR